MQAKKELIYNPCYAIQFECMMNDVLNSIQQNIFVSSEASPQIIDKYHSLLTALYSYDNYCKKINLKNNYIKK